MKMFCFSDSSGILASDRFFGVGLLVVKNVGDLGDKLCKNSQPVKELVKTSKNQRIDKLLEEKKYEEAIKILRGNYRFEMKFDTIGGKKTLPFYERMVDIFLSDSSNRFSVMIIDKQNPKFNCECVSDSWETYTKYIALLVAREMKNLPLDNLCIVVDEITKPHTKPLSLEDTIMSKIREEVAKDTSLNFENIFGAFSIESHSSLPMQLCDVLLGAVMYDYKKKHGLSSEKTSLKKETFVQKIRSSIGVSTLAEEFVVNDTKAYFEVSECNI
jgi:hypothetical protein